MKIIRWPLAIQGLLCVSLFWALAGHSTPAYALISGSMICGTSVPDYNYTFEPGADIRVPMTGNCYAARVYPLGAGPNLSIEQNSGSSPAVLQVLDPLRNMYLAQIPLGTYGASCLGSLGTGNGTCPPIPINGSVNYTYYIVGKAPLSPGKRVATIRLGVTAYGFPNYAEWLHNFTFRYTVASTACTLASPSSVDLNFGAIGGNSLASQSQRTTIAVNCPTQKLVEFYLIPGQPRVVPSAGISQTSLAGLNMQALWGDTDTAVDFSVSRRKTLAPGTNTLPLAFKPQLAAGQTPSGAFQSSYTLVINYL